MSNIRHIIFGNGERYSILTDDEGKPDFWITLFITEKIRPTQTQSSVINIIHHLIHLKLWEFINNRNLVEEFSCGKLLNIKDIHSIRDHCRLDTKDLKRQINPKNTNIVKFPSASTFSVTPIQVVTSSHASNRMTYIAEYLNFLAQSILNKKMISQDISISVKEMYINILKNRPRVVSKNRLGGDPDAKSAPPESFELIMEIVKENNPKNPFKNVEIKIRNALMFEILYATGIRSGELLALQIGDVDFNNQILSIVRRHDAKEDPRLIQPSVKTRERRIPINEEITKKIYEYVMNIRSKYKGARRHPYIFVTHKNGKYEGMPISNSTFVNRIVKPAISVDPRMLSEISRHGFRHYFNYRLSKRIDANNKAAKLDPSIKEINEKMEIQIRKELNGWASDHTAENYNLRHIREEANRLMLEDIEYWTKFIKK